MRVTGGRKNIVASLKIIVKALQDKADNPDLSTEDKLELARKILEVELPKLFAKVGGPSGSCYRRGNFLVRKFLTMDFLARDHLTGEILAVGSMSARGRARECMGVPTSGNFFLGGGDLSTDSVRVPTDSPAPLRVSFRGERVKRGGV